MSNPVTAFTDAAREFATAAAAASLATGGADPSVLLLLNGLPAKCDAAIEGLRSVSDDPEIADAVQACEVLLDLCRQTGDALLAQQPALGRYVVPEDAPLMVILERFYGGDAFAHVDEAEANNPEIVGSVLVPAGTALKLAPATV